MQKHSRRREEINTVVGIIADALLMNVLLRVERC
jgi:hypothetical protein